MTDRQASALHDAISALPSGRSRRYSPALRAPVGPVVIHQRVAFAEAAAVGESVLTTQPNGPAADEIRRLYREVTK
jgi:cellulose biosynthesis protein BcsQ